MNNLPSQPSAQPEGTAASTDAGISAAAVASTAGTSAPDSNQPANSSQPPAEQISQRIETDGDDTEAIGPTTTTASSKADPSAGPAVNITLLLTNGARHPYRIDQKYLRKRSVEVEEMDPFNISVYTLKELILRDWRSG